MEKLLLSPDFPNCHQVIFHSLPTLYRKKFLPLIPAHIPVTWIFYGYEYYHRRFIIEKYMDPLSRSYYRSWANPHILGQWAHRIFDHLRGETKQYKLDLKRINRFAHWNPAEYQKIRDRFNLKKFEYVPFSMGLPVHHLVSDPEYRYLLLGHSGALTVNHLDGLEDLPVSLVEKFDRIIIPLSYGAGNSYQNTVKRAARVKLGDKALILEKYMDRATYFNLLSRVKLAWMPQMRSMGGGNVLFCFKNNIPIVFRQHSIMYQFFAGHGFQVFSSEEVHSEIPILSLKQKVHNQKLLDRHFGANVIQQQYQNLLSPL